MIARYMESHGVFLPTRGATVRPRRSRAAACSREGCLAWLADVLARAFWKGAHGRFSGMPEARRRHLEDGRSRFVLHLKEGIFNLVRPVQRLDAYGCSPFNQTLTNQTLTW